MLNRKSLPVALKTVKDHLVWSLCGKAIILLVPYCPKPIKNVLFVSTAHSEPDLYEQAHKKPIFFDFYNSQRCRLDIVHQTLRDYSCQPTCNT